MTSRVGRKRRAFSLLEVIIATAILAGSAMVLFSLIALGTKYGNRAEVRTIAISQAQSVMDEFVAGFANQEKQAEIKGVLPSDPPRSFRISVTPFDIAGDKAIGDMGSAKSMPTSLYRVTVTLYESQVQLTSESVEPLCELSRLVRRTQPGEAQRSEANKSFANGSRVGGGASP